MNYILEFLNVCFLVSTANYLHLIILTLMLCPIQVNIVILEFRCQAISHGVVTII